MSQQNSLDEVVNAILEFDSDKAVGATKRALDVGVDPLKILEDGLTNGLRIVGEKFDRGELYTIHIVAAAEVFKKAMNVLEPRLAASTSKRKVLGKVVIGTVAGDIHDIGKNIVASMLLAAGFDVHDLGRDVPVANFIDKLKQVHADVVASSALLTTSMTAQREIVVALVKDQCRDNVKVIIGGAPVTDAWANEIGADGFADNAVQAVAMTKKLLNPN